MKKGFLYGIAAAALLASCGGNRALEQALRAAGDNRPELEKVLTHYAHDPADSLKYRAAVFLIENMPYHFSYSSPGIERFFEAAAELYASDSVSKSLPDPLDSLLRVHISSRDVVLQPDIQTISSGVLISNIDEAFEALKYPWAAGMSFDDFCENILPYRITTEPVEEWRSAYRARFQPAIDSLARIGATTEEVTRYFIGTRDQTIFYPTAFKPDLPPLLQLQMRAGNCQDYCNLGCYALRTFGIPAASEFTPNWGNRSMGHEWNALLRLADTLIPFMIGDRVEFGRHLVRSSNLVKVYRKTYSIQRQSLAMQRLKEEIPPLFRDPYFKDVSAEYFDPVDVEVDLDVPFEHTKKAVYIMVFDDKDWVAMDWAYKKGKKAVFRNMATGAAYIAMYYHDNRFYPASYPFYIDTQGRKQVLRPNPNATETVGLKRKYTDYKVALYCLRMLHGRFQGANRPDFSDAADLHVIEEIPEAVFNTVSLNTPGEYRYLRYLAGPDSFGNVAEIEFYDRNGRLLEGEIIGTEGSYYDDGQDRRMAFDKDGLTFFDAPIREGAWTGMAFAQPVTLAEIMYLPRNDDNFIRKGETYELYYWDNRWVSMGRQVGEKEGQTLIYNDVPKQTLLLLRNHTKGVEERIFTYEDGRQVWW